METKSLGHYLRSITFTKKHRCFEEGDCFEFHPGITYLVGDQGCGKSTLIAEVREHLKPEGGAERTFRGATRLELIAPGPVRVIHKDFERENPRIQSHFEGGSLLFQVQSLWKSHGEVVNAITTALRGLREGQGPSHGRSLVVLDEPDASLSLRSVYALGRELQALADFGVQIVAAVHNPALIAAIPEVLSLEHRRWMPSADFLKAMEEPRASSS